MEKCSYYPKNLIFRSQFCSLAPPSADITKLMSDSDSACLITLRNLYIISQNSKNMKKLIFCQSALAPPWEIWSHWHSFAHTSQLVAFDFRSYQVCHMTRLRKNRLTRIQIFNPIFGHSSGLLHFWEKLQYVLNDHFSCLTTLVERLVKKSFAKKIVPSFFFQPMAIII